MYLFADIEPVFRCMNYNSFRECGVSLLSIKDSGYTISHFLKLKKQKAKLAYLSKNYADKIDLCVIDNIRHISFVNVGESFEKLPASCKKDTILAVDKNMKQILVHFYTFVEADRVSKWKIYDIIVEDF